MRSSAERLIVIVLLLLVCKHISDETLWRQFIWRQPYQLVSVQLVAFVAMET